MDKVDYGNISKEKYLEADKKFRRALYQARCNAKKEKIWKGYLEELSKL